MVDERHQPTSAISRFRWTILEQARIATGGVWHQATRLRAVIAGSSVHGHRRRWLWLTLRITVSLALLAFVLWKAHITKFVHVMERIDLRLWVGALMVGVLTNLISAFQWRILLQSEGINLRARTVTAIYFLGHAFNQLLPSSIGGDVGKAVYIGRLSTQRIGAVSATLMARVIGVLGLLLTAVPTSIAAALIFRGFGWSLALILLGVGVVYATSLTALLMSPRLLQRLAGKRLASFALGRKLLELAETVSHYRRRPKVFWADTAVSLAFYTVSNLNFYLYGQALHLHTPFWFYWIAIPLTSLATMLPISLNGYGVRGATFVLLFALMGESAASSLSLSLLMELQLLIFAFVGVVVLLYYNRLLAQPAGGVPAAPGHVRAIEKLRAMLRRGAFMAQGTETVDSEPVNIVPVVSSSAAETTQLEREPAAAPKDRGFTTPFGRVRPPSFWRFRPATTIAMLAVVALVVVAGALATSTLFKSPMKVQLYTVSSHPLTSYVGGGGLTYPVQSLQLTYPVSAEVLTVNVQLGQTVRSGQQLMTLDGASTSAQIDQAYTQWQLAQNFVDQLRSAGASTTQIVSAEEQAGLAQSRYESLKAELKSSTFNGGAISAPFAGVVTDIRVGPGTLMHAGQALLTLQRLDSIIVRAEFPIDQVSQIHMGAHAEIDPAAGSKTYSGVVTSINPVLVKPGSATFEAWITVPNPQQELFTGQSVYARVSATQTMLTVPEVAVINPQSDAIVFVYNQGRAHVRHVVIGLRDIDQFGIVSGLQEGDQVIVSGQYQLADNDRVTVQP